MENTIASTGENLTLERQMKMSTVQISGQQTQISFKEGTKYSESKKLDQRRANFGHEKRKTCLDSNSKSVTSEIF
jgi:hypothetical protein